MSDTMALRARLGRLADWLAHARLLGERQMAADVREAIAALTPAAGVTDELCAVCGGNGVINIPGGVSVCDACNGKCWAPADRAAAAPADRCPDCSFDPTNMDDYCDKHRPQATAPAPERAKDDLLTRLDEIFGRFTASGCDHDASDAATVHEAIARIQDANRLIAWMKMGVSLGQGWVSKVTAADAPEPPAVMGAAAAPAEDDEFKAYAQRLEKAGLLPAAPAPEGLDALVNRLTDQADARERDAGTPQSTGSRAPLSDETLRIAMELEARAAEHRAYSGVPCQCESSSHADELGGWATRLRAVLARQQAGG